MPYEVCLLRAVGYIQHHASCKNINGETSAGYLYVDDKCVWKYNKALVPSGNSPK